MVLGQGGAAGLGSGQNGAGAGLKHVPASPSRQPARGSPWGLAWSPWEGTDRGMLVTAAAGLSPPQAACFASQGPQERCVCPEQGTPRHMACP